MEQILQPVSYTHLDVYKRQLGDKVNLTASNHPAAQELLYMSLGTGLGENNSRGAGFVNYRFL